MFCRTICLMNAGSHLAFARKYRPDCFQQVIGQQHVVRTLTNAMRSGRIAPGYLFCGPRGVGKTSLARIFAKSLNCAVGPTATPCGSCESCRGFSEGSCPDVLEIDGASNNGVGQAKEIKTNSRYLPSVGKFRVYIVDEVHMLSAAAFGVISRILEDPPDHAKFLFATTESHKLPPSFLGTCQRFDLRAISDGDIAAHLSGIARAEGIHLTEDGSMAIARASRGGMRDAESILEQVSTFGEGSVGESEVAGIVGALMSSDIDELARGVFGGKIGECLTMAADIVARGGDPLDLISALGKEVHKMLMGAGVDSGARVSVVSEIAGILSEAEDAAVAATDRSAVLESVLIQCCRCAGTATVEEVLAVLDDLGRR